MSDAAICPACIGLPEGQLAKAASNGTAQIVLSLPGIHCVACINAVERALRGMEGVANARVNLSMKRVTVGTSLPIAPEELIETLRNGGIRSACARHQPAWRPTADAYGRGLMTRLAVSGFAMMNVMLLSVAVWSGAIGATQNMFHWISASIALPAIALCRTAVLSKRMARAFGAQALNMDVPISLAILLAAGMSLFETLVGGHHAYFDAAISLTFFLLIGRYLDYRSRKAAASAAAAAFGPRSAPRHAPQGWRAADGGFRRPRHRRSYSGAARWPYSR